MKLRLVPLTCCEDSKQKCQLANTRVIANLPVSHSPEQLDRVTFDEGMDGVPKHERVGLTEVIRNLDQQSIVWQFAFGHVYLPADVVVSEAYVKKGWHRPSSPHFEGSNWSVIYSSNPSLGKLFEASMAY
jgi:hypothetical protein